MYDLDLYKGKHFDTILNNLQNKNKIYNISINFEFYYDI